MGKVSVSQVEGSEWRTNVGEDAPSVLFVVALNVLTLLTQDI